MLSICIPVYNFDVNALVDELLAQAARVACPVEILVFDDFSQSFYRARNRRLSQLPQVHYLEFDYNLGRSRIRNRLADFAHGEWLLFIDCDMMPETPAFLAAYADMLGQAPVVYGGRTQGPRPKHSALLLRWRYGQKTECQKAIIRQLQPYSTFMGGNFLIEKELC